MKEHLLANWKLYYLAIALLTAGILFVWYKHKYRNHAPEPIGLFLLSALWPLLLMFYLCVFAWAFFLALNYKDTKL